MSFDSTDLNACAELVHRADPDRFRAAMAAPVHARQVLFPLFAANVEVSRAPWVTKEHLIAEMRLQWWIDAFEEIAEGGAVRRHEVVTPLAQTLDREGALLLQQLAEARSWDIYREPFDDEAHFKRYITHTSANLLLAGARALGSVDEGAVLDIGYAAGLANFLRAVPELERQGRIPLVDGRPESIAALAQDGLNRLASARGRVPATARPAVLAAWQAGPILRRIVQDPRRVANGDLALPEITQRARLMWTAATGRV